MKTPSVYTPLERSFFERPTDIVARQLCGKILVRQFDGVLMAGMITETEAYFGEDDPASHAARGPTERSAHFWGPGGISYVYLIYGMHNCLNVIAEPEQTPGAVLIRAMEPLAGIDFMAANRKTSRPFDICSGPAKLCQALNIDRSLNKIDMTDENSPIYIASGATEDFEICVTPRIGIKKAAERLLRFYIVRVL
ncbi:DNA-3-methyladenine glycosylase [Myxococcota bacterium]|nr:DNA-3-methyladenine glycosylase [Myxococcota bacterium]MBU1379406.1 DNA-3-methyladenine glycosylase [Myxococcota bacterium]MBU1495352.1 DNA-3-methyladenine glycosylase [Myxococcota bacterium]